ncbi:LuxS/MPP-like metallohydrolase [Viridothelium virens]|uniref:LuxS/MPP-like metallohydrolase n=1 Tax=Viridothelium virens TaxID=1048519 RepID=A0A6A6HCW4_VIRVR|nr:LuxS/MPP-like metallohydrolase [Viridothelium virens]
MPEPINQRTDVPAERLAEQLEKPELDDRTYRVIRLPNKLEALLIHDAETDKASAALDVNVGAFSDAADMPGIAHAVEHLLFMGTEKYPVENDYNLYLSSNNGHSNAYTASTSTNYYFEVGASSTPSNSGASSAANTTEDLSTTKTKSPLYGALDRFAQFFIKPLFLEETLDRELQAVDSENKKNLQSDVWRLHQLTKALSNPQHPFHTFSTGNLDTLKHEPLKRGVRIRDEFIKHYEKHYSANRMKLVVLGKESLDELESWVEEFFSPVVNKDLPQNRWDHVHPFTAKELITQVFAKPVMDARSIDLYFPYPDEEHLFDSHPSRYLSHLIGHEGPGSILSLLKAKGWANSLSSGVMPVCPGSAFFTMSIRLAEDGLREYKEVLKIIFQYISMLKETLPQKWIFEEMKEMTEVEFRFRQKSPASKTTSRLSSWMQKPLPRDRLLSAQSVLKTFDPDAITKGLAHLRPNNFRFTLVSQTFPGDWSEKEQWYGTQYKYEKIPDDFVAELKEAASSNKATRPSSLHLPHKNEFIPTRLEVERKEVDKPAKAPKLIRRDANVRTWFKKDDQFWVPKTNLHIFLRTPLLHATPLTSVLTRLYRELVEDALSEYAYDAEIAGLDYDIGNQFQGLDIRVAGYNDKLPLLLEKVLLTVRDLEIKDERFRVIHERLVRGFKNWYWSQPYAQVSHYSRWMIQDVGWINDQYLDELPSISAEDVRRFFPQLLNQMYIEVLAHGNLYREDALRYTDLVEKTLRPRPLPPTQWPLRRNLMFPEGSNFVYERELKDPGNVNHCIEYVLFVSNDVDRTTRAKLLLLSQIAHEPVFDTLRTKEQLGYIVFSSSLLSGTIAGWRILIQSERTPEYLESRIEAFIVSLGKVLEEMSEGEFEGHKVSLINMRLEKLKNLGQETARFWTHISNEFFDFEQVDEDVAHIQPLTKPDVLEFFRYHMVPSSPHRTKASIHLRAQSSASDDTVSETREKAIAVILKILSQLGVAKVDEALLRERFKDVELQVDSITNGILSFLENDAAMAKDEVAKIIEQVKMILAQVFPAKPDTEVNGSPAMPNGTVNNTEQAGQKPSQLSNGITEPQVIKDPWSWKAGMEVSKGPRAVKDLSEFEELEPKL